MNPSGSPAPAFALSVGELAAITTSVCWTFTSLLFAAAGRRIGATALNLVRITLAWLMLIVVHRIAVEAWIPHIDHTGLLLLALSGVLGFAVCDQLQFMAFLDIGPRLTALVMTLTPVFVAILALSALEETLSGAKMLGMAVTIAGVAWVALERPDATAQQPHPHRTRGLFLAVLAAGFQAAGLVLSKLGIGHTRLDESQHIPLWSVSLLRVTAGMLAIMGLALLHRAGRSATARGLAPDGEEIIHPQTPLPNAKGRHPFVTAVLLCLMGAVLGPVVGVWCSLVAIDRSHAGIAATLMSLTPVFILPLAAWLEREHISWRAVAGAVVAVVGVGILTIAA